LILAEMVYDKSRRIKTVRLTLNISIFEISNISRGVRDYKKSPAANLPQGIILFFLTFF